MSITTINFKDHYTNAKKNHENKEFKWKPAFAPSFLDHCLPILSSIKLETEAGQVSATDTFKALSSTEIVKTPNGEMSGSNIAWLLKMLYFTKRAQLIPASQIRDSRLATFTPLALYAHKLYNDVQYSSWKREDKALPLFLGSTLDLILEVDSLPNLDIDQILEERKNALTFKSGAKQGTQEKAYNYKCGITTLNDIALPRPVIMMKLQLWLAHASVRNTESMILDPLNWDNVPEALDTIATLPVLTVKDKIAKVKAVASSEDAGDIPWA